MSTICLSKIFYRSHTKDGEGTVFTGGVPVHKGGWGGVHHFHPIILPLVPGPFPGGGYSGHDWMGYPHPGENGVYPCPGEDRVPSVKERMLIYPHLGQDRMGYPLSVTGQDGFLMWDRTEWSTPPPYRTGYEGCHTTGKTGNLKVYFSRQGKCREFTKKY